MGLLDKMNQLETELKLSEQNNSKLEDKNKKKAPSSSTKTSAPVTDSKETSVTAEDVKQVDSAPEKGKKKVPQLKMGTGKKSAVSAKKSPTNDKFTNLADGIKKPDTLANAKKTSQSSLHTHLNKTDQHGVSHKDRIEQELQAQVKRIKKIMAISVAALLGLIFAIWLIVKIVGWFNSPDSNDNTRGISYFQMKSSVIQYAHSDGFDPDKFDRAFERFNKQASPADKAKAIKLKARLLKERANNK